MALPIHWYAVPDDTPTLPFESAISNSQLDIDRNINGDVGEVFNSWKAWNWEPLPPGLFTGHYCGTRSDHANGAAYDPGASYPIGALGWPRCCAPPMKVGASALYGGDAQIARYAGPPVGIIISPVPGYGPVVPPGSYYRGTNLGIPIVPSFPVGTIFWHGTPATLRVTFLADLARADCRLVVWRPPPIGTFDVQVWDGRQFTATVPDADAYVYVWIGSAHPYSDFAFTVDVVP